MQLLISPSQSIPNRSLVSRLIYDDTCFSCVFLSVRNGERTVTMNTPLTLQFPTQVSATGAKRISEKTQPNSSRPHEEGASVVGDASVQSTQHASMVQCIALSVRESLIFRWILSANGGKWLHAILHRGLCLVRTELFVGTKDTAPALNFLFAHRFHTFWVFDLLYLATCGVYEWWAPSLRF